MSPSSELAARLEKMAVTREWIAQQRSQEAHVSECEGLGTIAKIERQLSEEHAKVAADLRAAAQAVREREWRPISEAPKDEWGVLAFVPTYYQGRGAVIKAIWLDGEWYDNFAHTVEPTHYRPLPAPPEVGE